MEGGKKLDHTIAICFLFIIMSLPLSLQVLIGFSSLRTGPHFFKIACSHSCTYSFIMQTSAAVFFISYFFIICERSKTHNPFLGKKKSNINGCCFHLTAHGFLCTFKWDDMLCVMFITLNIMQYIFLSGCSARSCSCGGNVANEFNPLYHGRLWALSSAHLTLWAWICDSNHRLRLLILIFKNK